MNGVEVLGTQNFSSRGLLIGIIDVGFGVKTLIKSYFVEIQSFHDSDQSSTWHLKVAVALQKIGLYL